MGKDWEVRESTMTNQRSCLRRQEPRGLGKAKELTQGLLRVMGVRMGSAGQGHYSPRVRARCSSAPPPGHTQMPCTAHAAAWTGSRVSPAWRWPPSSSLRGLGRLSEGAAGPRGVAWVWAWRARRATRTGDPRGARSGC